MIIKNMIRHGLTIIHLNYYQRKLTSI
ncbi:rCG29541 [Rattus norvegicus]|uniref:RCG29541 n=1 Tax=Rattus norvegicus TaxID=10116 RepID=A6IM79_RAT|nr:rCG29541 [Rattus norvegicus]